MVTQLRIALPPLHTLTPDTLVEFALFDKRGRLQRSSEVALNALTEAVPGAGVHAILHPGDAIVTTINVPPVPAARLEAAVHGRVEPMVLSELDDLCIAHGRRAPSGDVQVCWTDRRQLLRAWQLMHETGLKVLSLTPVELLNADKESTGVSLPLRLPVDGDIRWQSPLPDWSLARPEWRPAQQERRWRSSIRWAVAAALAWMVGLHLYAAQLHTEEERLRQQMELAFLEAFPTIPTVLDPVRQAQAQVNALRERQGQPTEDAFMSLAISAASHMPFAAGHVSALSYGDGELRLTLAESRSTDTRSTAINGTEAGSSQSSASLRIEQDPDASNQWRIRRAPSLASSNSATVSGATR